MKHDIRYSRLATEDMLQLRAFERAAVLATIETHLTFEPCKESKTRIKRLRDMKSPEYRLRVGDEIRVFYDVCDGTVEVARILTKDLAEKWLLQFGVRS